jgi:hypothetical protein
MKTCFCGNLKIFFLEILMLEDEGTTLLSNIRNLTFNGTISHSRRPECFE